MKEQHVGLSEKFSWGGGRSARKARKGQGGRIWLGKIAGKHAVKPR